MRARLKAKARRWKVTALRSTKTLRRKNAIIRRQARRIAQLKTQLAELEQLTRPQSIHGHTYPAQMVALAVFMVAQAQVSLRGAAKTIAYFSDLMGWHYKQPSHVTVLRWVLRAGLYQLRTAAAQRRGHYVGIFDESISMGGEKLLLLLGLRLPDGVFDLDRPLSGADVEVLAMQVSPSWTADNVVDFLDEALVQNPEVRLDYVVTDGGPNLRKALRDKVMDRVGDCTHVLMNLVKKYYQHHESLSQLCAQIGTLRRKTLLGQYGCLAPPTLRDKDRFLRIFNILDWVARIEHVKTRLPAAAREKLTFLAQYSGLLDELSQVRSIIDMAGRVFKSQGLSESSMSGWAGLILEWRTKHSSIYPTVELILNGLDGYMAAHRDLIAKHGRLMCCSDIIESTFGRYKNKGGVKAISADVLKIPLYHVEITPQFVRQALSRVSSQEVHDWETENTSPTHYGQLRALREHPESVMPAA